MKKLVTIFALFCALSYAFAQQTSTWVGILTAGPQKLTMLIRLTKAADGTWSGTLEVPEQKSPKIPMTSISMDDKKLTWAIQTVGATYEGDVQPDGKSVKGKFTQNNMTFDLNFERNDNYKVKKLERPQTPKKPYPYKEEEVSFENKQGGNRLAGTLTTPSKGGPFPVAIMITGSGAQDRDESIMDHRPFMVIADALTRKGIAVLRCDDRGVGKSTGNFITATTADFATDIRAAYIYLKSRKDIDPKKIGVIGHSEGGLVGPMVAASEKKIAFVVMLAGPGVNGEQVVVRQSEAIGTANKAPKADVDRDVKVLKAVISLIKKNLEPTELKKQVLAIVNAENDKVTGKDHLTPEQVNLMVDQQIASFASPWFRYFLSYEPSISLKKVKCPVLVLNGDKDLQVLANQNVPEVVKALKAGGNKKFEVHVLPGLNHLFQHCKTGSPMEYAQISETFSPDVLKLMANWILKSTKR